MHIITCLDEGGAEAVLTRLCIYDLSSHHIVISLKDKGKYGTILESRGIEVYELEIQSFFGFICAFFKLVQLIKCIKPCAVQTWMYHSDFIGGIAARIAGVSRVIWGVRMSSMDVEGSLRTKCLIKICAILSKFIPYKIVYCAKKSEDVHRLIGYDPSKSVVIGNGYDLSSFKRDDNLRKKVRNQFKIDQDTVLLGFVARYDPLKDHSNLLQSLALIKKSVNNFQCLLVGKGLSCENAQLTQEIESLGLVENIVLAGSREDIPAIMNALDLHVMSSLSEGFPNVLAEAMACGTPCVSTDVGDAGFILAAYGLICPPQSPNELSRAIIDMVNEYRSNPELWEERSIKGIEHIRENYSLGKMLVKYKLSWS